MPKQGNHLSFFFAKTIKNLTLYVRAGVGLARHRTSLTGERWHSDPKFAGSRKSAACLATAAQMASVTYRAMPAAKRRVSHYRQLVGWIKKKLAAGVPAHAIEEKLNNLISQINKATKPPKRRKGPKPFMAPPNALIMLFPQKVAPHWRQHTRIRRRRTWAG